MRILFDQATPVPIRFFLEGHTSALLRTKDGTVSKTASYSMPPKPLRLMCSLRLTRTCAIKQNLADRKIAIIVLGKQRWPEVRPHVHLVVAAINAAKPGAYVEVEVPEDK